MTTLYLIVGRSLHEERISACSAVREAFNVLQRRDARAQGDALQELVEGGNALFEPPAGTAGTDDSGSVRGTSDPEDFGSETAPGGVSDGDGLVDGRVRGNPPSGVQAGQLRGSLQRLSRDPAQTLLHESFLQWAPRYSGPKFNLIHCDFPYGIGVFSGPQMASGAAHEYGDGEDVYFRLLEAFCQNLDRFCSLSAHVLFWYSERHGPRTRELFRELAPSLAQQTHPLIWLKSDNAGVAPDPRHTPRHVYETCMLLTRGSRQIVRVVSDAYSAPTDKRFHVSTKPEPVLRHFMSMLVDDHTTLLDPTAGGGSAIRAAESLGAATALGLEVDETTVGVARMALRQFRTLRSGGAQGLGL